MVSPVVLIYIFLFRFCLSRSLGYYPLGIVCLGQFPFVGDCLCFLFTLRFHSFCCNNLLSPIILLPVFVCLCGHPLEFGQPTSVHHPKSPTLHQREVTVHPISVVNSSSARGGDL